MTKYEYAADVYKKAYDAAQASGNAPFTAQAEAIAEEAAGAYSRAQGEAFQRGQEFRQGLAPSDVDAMGYDHQALFDMVQSGNAVEIDIHGEKITNFANVLAESSQAASAAASAEESDWQGESGARVAAFLQQSGNWLNHTSEATALAGNRYSQQSAAVDHARREMPPVVPFDQKGAMDRAADKLVSPNPADIQAGVKMMEDIAAQQQRAQEAHEKAAQVVTGMNGGLYETGRTMPAYAPAPALGGQGLVGHDEGTKVSGFAPGTGGGTYGGPGSGPGTGPGTGPGVLPSPGPEPAGRSTGSGVFGPGNPPPVQPNPVVPKAPNAGPGLGPMGLGGGQLGGAGADIERKGRAGAGRGSAAGRLLGTDAKAAQEKLGEGKGSGAERGAKAANERLTRGTTAAGKGGAAGAAGAGANKGKKEEDEERKSKYVQGDDPDEMFDANISIGPDGVKVVPPVIG
ncbi:hypothetical protein AB5J62_09580 [Amycolatopsis sp. cg5]|uniref:hypothetical protein n=1 Tax=Amycolatopsis sp. cg5 TaxID=3238802 RepID=UPI003525C091